MNELPKAATEDAHTILNSVITKGDLSKLSDQEKTLYYKSVCESVGLNPLTRPFEYMTLQGKTVLYARKDATEQLRKIHGISIEISSRELVEECYIVTAKAKTPDGRTDEAIGAVSISGLRGEAKANSFMKAETKAKRRVTLSISGLGMLDEHEVAAIPGAHYGESSAEDHKLVRPDTLQELKAYMTIRETPQGIVDQWFKLCGVNSLERLPELFVIKLIDRMRTEAVQTQEAHFDERAQ